MLDLIMSLDQGARFALALPLAIAGAAILATFTGRF